MYYIYIYIFVLRLRKFHSRVWQNDVPEIQCFNPTGIQGSMIKGQFENGVWGDSRALLHCIVLQFGVIIWKQHLLVIMSSSIFEIDP